LVLKNEAYSIIGCCLEVHRILGKGFLEAVYKDALSREFALRNIPFEREKKFEIYYKDYLLTHYYVSDFIVMDKVVLEVKAQKDFHQEHYKQLINYLAISKRSLGLLVNFGGDSLAFKRVVL
jgi:GxxExxY protein